MVSSFPPFQMPLLQQLLDLLPPVKVESPRWDLHQYSVEVDARGEPYRLPFDELIIVFGSVLWHFITRGTIVRLILTKINWMIHLAVINQGVYLVVCEGFLPESLFLDTTSIPEAAPEIALLRVQMASLLIFLEGLYDHRRIRECVRLGNIFNALNSTGALPVFFFWMWSPF